MSNWPILDGMVPVHLPVTYNSPPSYSQGSASLATPTAWNTPTAWTELIASTPFAVCGLLLSLSITPLYGYADFAIGAAGSEQRIGVPIHNRNQHLIRRFLPIALPAGTRISFRVAAVATGTASAQVGLVPQTSRAPVGYSRWAIYGHDEWASNDGIPSIVTCDPGATTNTKGAWSEVVASLPFTARFVTALMANRLSSSNSGASSLFDIGTGAAGAESAVLRDVFLAHQGAIRQMAGEFSAPIHIPAGSRVAIRSQCSTGGTNLARLLGGWLAFGG